MIGGNGHRFRRGVFLTDRLQGLLGRCLTLRIIVVVVLGCTLLLVPRVAIVLVVFVAAFRVFALACASLGEAATRTSSALA